MSLLQFLGVGTVTATKDTNTNEVMVYAPFLFPQAEGRLSANAERVERVSKNAAGEEVRSTALKSNSIPAVWRKMDNSNRISAPDVREGSKVSIYRIPGQNVYYWSLDGVNPDTFRMETVQYGWNANPHVGENGEFEVDNFYLLNFDTRNGLIQLRTSEANGEATTFDIQINTKTGTINFGGKNGSMLKYDDVERSFTYTNQDGSVLRVVKEEIIAHAPKSISLFTDQTVNLKTKTLKIQAEEAFVDIGVTKWKGRFEHTGDSTQLGDHDQVGRTSQEGNYIQEGDFTQDGNQVTFGLIIGTEDVRTSTVSLNLHPHSGVEGGKDTSGPPVPS
jgi:hypothetical protein